MSQILFPIIIVFFVVALARQTSYWSWLWQIKEYRWDRIMAYFQDIGVKGTVLLLIGYHSLKRTRIPVFTAKSILITLVAFLVGISIMVSAIWAYLSDIAFIVSGLDISSLPHVNLSKDSINPAAVKAFAAGLLDSLRGYEFVIGKMIVIFLTMPLVILIVVEILNFLSGIFKFLTIIRARKKMEKFPNLKVIGITGSYGKSTAKEILAEILSKKYKVLKTPANINTPIGIARLVLDKLDESHEVFIVEMGAYKVGEIKQICDIVHPRIGIITAINEQHLALFGSIENTIKAKFELIKSLPKDGLAVINVGDKNIQVGLEKENCTIGNESCSLKARIKQYSVGAKADVYAINVASTYNYVKFKYISGADMMDFTLNIIGAHNVSNALAAIIVARDLGMDLNEISFAAQKINRLIFTLKTLPGPNGSILVDDTYNANPDGVIAAVKYAENQRGRKFLIISSLIELGREAHKVHENLGKEISTSVSKMFVLDDHYTSDIRRGAETNKDSIVEIKTERDPKKIAKFLEDELKSTDIVLFLNRGARKVLEILKNKN